MTKTFLGDQIGLTKKQTNKTKQNKKPTLEEV